MQPTCGQWSDCGIPGAGRCRLGLRGGTPSLGQCNLCDKNPLRGKMVIAEQMPAHVPTAAERAKTEAERIALLRSLWLELHWQAALGKLTPEWLDAFGPRIPCGECKRHWHKIVEELPPVFGPESFAWTVEAHNRVNRTLGKPEFTMDDARRFYSLNE